MPRRWWTIGMVEKTASASFFSWRSGFLRCGGGGWVSGEMAKASAGDRTMMIGYQEKKIIDNLVCNAEKRVRQASSAPVVGLVGALLFLVLAFYGVDLIESKSKPMLDAACGGATATAKQPVTHGELRKYAELQSLITVNKTLRMAFDMSVVLVLIGAIWQVFRFRQKAQHELVQLRAIQFLLSRQTDSAEQSLPSKAPTSCGR